MGLDDIQYSAIGLAGETGEVLEFIKKSVCRGKEGMDPNELLLELGDVQHYLTRIALKYGWTLQDVMEANKAKLDARGSWS